MDPKHAVDIAEARSVLAARTKELKDAKAKRETARKKLSDAFLPAIAAVASFPEATNMFHDTPMWSGARKIAYKKWVNLCTTKEEARQAWLGSPRNLWRRNPALAKWNVLSCAEVEKATTYEDLVWAFHDAPSDDDLLSCFSNEDPPEGSAQVRAMKKLLEHCPTLAALQTLQKRLNFPFPSRLESMWQDKHNTLRARLPFDDGFRGI